jgi:Cof subfamily protein (haloacid dehalogenase superfamily)
MTVRMIATDLDRTLLNRDLTVSDRSVAALRAARDAGIVVVAATGRAPLSAMDRLARHDIVDMLVCSNGSLIHDPRTNRTIDRFPIDATAVAEVFACLDVALPGVSFCWEAEDHSAWDDGFHEIAIEHPDLWTFAPAPRPDPSISITKLMVLHPTLEREMLLAALREQLDVPVTLASSGVKFVEVTGEGISKAHALGVLAERFDVDPSDVVAFGDNHNDIAMLQWAGSGVAVANALPEVHAIADEVIGDHHDDAVAAHIETILR